jgi:hypothetical protein
MSTNHTIYWRENHWKFPKVTSLISNHQGEATLNLQREAVLKKLWNLPKKMYLQA